MEGSEDAYVGYMTIRVSSFQFLKVESPSLHLLHVVMIAAW